MLRLAHIDRTATGDGTLKVRFAALFLITLLLIALLRIFYMILPT